MKVEGEGTIWEEGGAIGGDSTGAGESQVVG